MTVTQEDIERGLRELGLDEDSHVLVHASYKAFGDVDGGPATVARALAGTVATLMMPASTWEHSAVWDESGLFDGNAYREEAPEGASAQPFAHDTPIDRNIGIISETLRRTYDVRRSSHPLQSFVAHGRLADELTRDDGTDFSEPIRRMMEAGGYVLLMGVSHTSSTAIHLGEQLAGRQLFMRHALTEDGVRGIICGGCGNAFDDLQPHVDHLEQRVTVGQAMLRCYRVQPYVEAARTMIERDPRALLCRASTGSSAGCVRCEAHMARVPA
jgi:aminoglycoside 3-N-acetyltransferase